MKYKIPFFTQKQGGHTQKQLDKKRTKDFGIILTEVIPRVNN